MLSKLKEALFKVLGNIKCIFSNLKDKLSKLNVKEKLLNILKSIKNYDVKNIKSDCLGILRKIKSSIFNIVGSDKCVDFVSKMGYKRLNGAAIGVFVFFVICAAAGSNLNFGYSVCCDGKVVAITESRAQAMEAFNNAKSELASVENAAMGNVSISFAIANKDNFQNTECASNSIIAMYDGRSDAYGIYADGVLITALKTKEEAEEILEAYKKEYTTETALEVTFNKNVEILAARIATTKIADKEEAVTALKTPVGGIKIHEVAEGETISGIAQMTGTTTNKLLAMNPDVTPETLQIGTKLNVSDNTPAVAVRTKEAVTELEKIAYDTNQVADSNQYKGVTIVVSDGIYGEKEVSYDVYKENGIVTNKVATAENILKEPVTKQVKVGTKARPAKAATGTFRNPFYAGIVTSRYGSRSRGFHTGIDLAGSTGSPVYAADGGTVSFTGWNGGYGKMIKINHGNGYVTYYAHLSSINVSNGQKVAKGEMIGRVGNTGNSTGPHLHFEIRLNGRTLNPANYMR